MYEIIESSIKIFESSLGSKAGLTYMLIQSFMLTLISFWAKILTRIPAYGVTYYRSLVMYLSQLILIKKYNIDPIPYDKKLHNAMIWRGLFGFIGLGSYFYSVKTIPLMEAATLFNLSPILVGIGAAIYLGEAFRKMEIVSLAVSFVGFILIVKPPFLFPQEGISEIDSKNHLNGTLAASVTAVCMMIVTLILRKHKSNLHPIIPNQIFAGANILFAPIVIIVAQYTVFPTLYEWFLLILVGLLSNLALLIRTRAIHLEKAGKVSILNYTGILFSYLFDVFFLNEDISLLSLLGSGLIISGAITVFLVKGEA